MPIQRVYSDDDLLALSGLQHLAYCERQWALIHVEQVWEDSADTLRGDYFHERVDTAGYTCASGVRAERAVHLVSHALGIYGIADVVEFDAQRSAVPLRPVEYKVGHPKIEDWDRVQLAAQVMCLEEMYAIELKDGDLFYGRTRRRERVSIGNELRERVSRLAHRAHELFEAGNTPLVEKMAKCRRCSLLDACVPSLSNRSVAAYWDRNGESMEVLQ